MRALQFAEFGPVSNLRLLDVPDPKPDSKTAIVKVAAGSISPSDVRNVEGKMEGTTLPRVPGVDRRRSVGNRRRYRLLDRRQSCGALGRSRRESSAKTKGAIVGAGGGDRYCLPRRCW